MEMSTQTISESKDKCKAQTVRPMRYGAVQVLPAGNTVDETSCYKSSNTIYVTSLFLSFPRMVSQGRGVQRFFILPEKNIIDNHFVHNFIIGRLKSCNRFPSDSFFFLQRNISLQPNPTHTDYHQLVSPN